MKSEAHSIFFRATLDQLPLGIFLLDQKGQIYEWNAWMSEKTGISLEKALGKTLVELVPGFDHPRFCWAIDMVFLRKAPQVLSHALNRYVIPIPLKLVNRYGITMMQQKTQISLLITLKKEELALVSIVDVTEKTLQELALIESATRLREESLHDPLTHLYNRRFLTIWLENELLIAKRYHYSIACLMVDLDHFKHINDTYGHALGDQVLKDFVQVINTSVRDSDICVRYGGEEFVVILSRCTLSDAIIRAEAIVTAMRNAVLGGLNVGSVTCSIGVSVCEENALSCTQVDLLEQADKRLYKAKQAGRNRVCWEKE